MAEENNISVAETHEVAATEPPAKKTRQPRKPKSTVEASAVTSAQPAKKSPAKRASKAAPAKNTKTTARNTNPVSSKAAAVGAQVLATVAHSDELADLIKLEEENKNLRKQLSEKLRSENAELRKRLGHN